MSAFRSLSLFSFLALPVLVSLPALGQQTNVILRGKVTMDDGSAPGKSVGLQRVCTDAQTATPGPLTESDGDYVWRLNLDFMATRRCFIEATMSGHTSTQVELSNINPTNPNIDLPPIKLTLKGGDPYMLGAQNSNDIPGKSKTAFDAGMMAVTSGDVPGGLAKFESAVAENPKFAVGWQHIGILHMYQGNEAKAREAFARAAQENPKMLAPHVILTRLAIKDKDWAGAAKLAATTIPLDKDKVFPELYLHQAVAAYHLKDLTAAEAQAKRALDPKNKRPAPRAEYALGRILEAKGDTAGAKEHMQKYLELNPEAQDAAQIKAHIDGMGKPEVPEPDLEVITR